jgi:hypothetical protein
MSIQEITQQIMQNINSFSAGELRQLIILLEKLLAEKLNQSTSNNPNISNTTL